jgi:hypothetical protein
VVSDVRLTPTDHALIFTGSVVGGVLALLGVLGAVAIGERRARTVRSQRRAGMRGA